MADIFDEMNEEIRAERTRALAMRYGALCGLLLVVALIGFGGYEAWQWNLRRKAEAAATPFIVAMQAADALPTAGPAPAPARKAVAEQFAEVVTSAPDGYRTLARFREAALQADAGQADAALKLWDDVASDATADPLLRGLADLLWAQHEVDRGDPVAITARLQSLDTAGNVWRPLAQETRAMLALRQNDRPTTARILRALSADPTVSQPARDRARGLLAIVDDQEAPG